MKKVKSKKNFFLVSLSQRLLSVSQPRARNPTLTVSMLSLAFFFFQGNKQRFSLVQNATKKNEDQADA